LFACRARKYRFDELADAISSGVAFKARLSPASLYVISFQKRTEEKETSPQKKAKRRKEKTLRVKKKRLNLGLPVPTA
jgi:hypothetical protein